MSMTTIDATLAARRAELNRELADLRAALPRLALAASGGDPAAADELTRTEERIQTLERDLKRLSLARQEADRQVDVARQQAAVDERRRLELAYQEVATGRRSAYLAYEHVVDALVDSITAATTAGDRLDGLAAQLGRPATSWPTRLDLIDLLLSKMWVPLERQLPAPGRPRQWLVEPVPEESTR